MKRKIALAAYAVFAAYVLMRLVRFNASWQDNIISVDFSVLWLYFYASAKTIRAYAVLLAAGAFLTGLVHGRRHAERAFAVCAVAGILFLAGLHSQNIAAFALYPFVPVTAGLWLSGYGRRAMKQRLSGKAACPVKK